MWYCMCSGGQEAWCSTVCVQEGRRPGVVLYVFRRAGGLVWYCMCSGGQEAWCGTVCVQEGRYVFRRAGTCSGGQEAWCGTVCVQEDRRPGVVLYVFRRAGMCSGGQVRVQEDRRPGVVLYVFRRTGGLVWYCMCSGGQEAWCSIVCVAVVCLLS